MTNETKAIDSTTDCNISDELLYSNQAEITSEPERMEIDTPAIINNCPE